MSIYILPPSPFSSTIMLLSFLLSWYFAGGVVGELLPRTSRLKPIASGLRPIHEILGSSSSSSSGGSAASSPLITPDASPRGQGWDPFSRAKLRPLALPGNFPMVLPKPFPQTRSFLGPKKIGIRLPGGRPLPVQGVDKAKGKATVVGPGRIEAMSDSGDIRTQQVRSGKGATWRLKDDSKLVMGGHATGGHVKVVGRGDGVKVKVETGPTGSGYFQDRRNVFDKYSKTLLGPNEKVEKVFRGDKDKTAKVRAGVSGDGSAHVMALKVPQWEETKGDTLDTFERS